MVPRHVRSIPSEEQLRRRWSLWVNGQLVPLVESVVLECPNYGVLEYGDFAPGRDGCRFAENNGGGSVVFPYSIVDGDELCVGLIREERDNLYGTHFCAIGGFCKSGESHLDAAKREYKEETGVDPTELFELPGFPMTSARGLFVCNLPRNEGVHAYAHKVPRGNLVGNALGYVNAFWDSSPERTIHFVPWRKAVEISPDALVMAGIAKLLQLHAPEMKLKG